MLSTTQEPNPSPPAGPLNELELQGLTQAIRGLSHAQLVWASGYLAGIANNGSLPAAANDGPRLTILYASQSGNARSIAESLGASAANRGLPHRTLSVADFRARDLTEEALLVLVTSTQGEGEPPENALDLYRFLHGKRAPRLDGLRYTVFGLGDSSYQHFCQTAKDFDQRLHALGAERIQERIEADIDFQHIVDRWMPTTLDRLETLLPDRKAEVVPLIRDATPVRVDRNHPYRAEVLDNRRITTSDALSEVRHVAIGIEPGSLSYAPGDAVGIRFSNDPALAEEILADIGVAGSTEIDLEGTALPIAEALIHRLELTQLHPRVVSAWAKVSGSTALQALSEQPDALRSFAAERQFIDLLGEYPARPDATTLAGLLLPMQSRLYSIASSAAELDDEIHLTVSTLRYQAHGRDHLGGASGFVAERRTEGEAIDVYVAENPSFHLPEDGDTPILMIGAGTGIAPFRAFLQHRQALGHRGPNWLIPGFRHFHRDFLYQTDWLGWRRSGLLDRVSPTFSRDGDHRDYVQDRLREEGAEVKRWLAQGARIYVCGAKAMELEIRATLTEIACTHGGLSEDAARECIENLRAEGRYQRDVY